MSRVRSSALARLASTAGDGVIDVRVGAATTLHVRKRVISLNVRLPNAGSGGDDRIILRGRLLGDGSTGALPIAFTAVDLRKRRGGIELRQATRDVAQVSGTLRFDGDDAVIDVRGLDGVTGQRFALPVSGSTLTMRVALRPARAAAGGTSAGRSARTLNLTTLAVGDQVEALRWIIEVDEPGQVGRRFELGGVLDLATRSIHALTIAEVAPGGPKVARDRDPARLISLLERQITSSLRGRGLADLRIVGGIGSIQ